MKVLGIETSCDETAVSIVEGNEIISEIVSSQIDIHSKYGGVVPEIASREHLKKLNLILETCFDNANLNIKDIDAVSVTRTPGLEGSLLVGKMVARTISFLLKVPLIEVNHLEAHLFASVFTPPFVPPVSRERVKASIRHCERGKGAKQSKIPLNPPLIKGEREGFDTKFTEYLQPSGIGLIISGGHTRLVYIKEWGNYKILGNTRDDAVGECFDKVASILGLPYPGGPGIEKVAEYGNPLKFRFPVAKLGDSYDFSYSGIKTAVLYKIKYDFNGNISEKQRNDIAASFQRAAFEPLVNKSIKAAKEYKVNWLFVCGGVAANKKLHEVFKEKTVKENFKVIFPRASLCTDNASMVAACGQFYLNRKS